MNFQDGIDCGGAYIKLLSHTDDLNLVSIHIVIICYSIYYVLRFMKFYLFTAETAHVDHLMGTYSIYKTSYTGAVTYCIFVSIGRSRIQNLQSIPPLSCVCVVELGKDCPDLPHLLSRLNSCFFCAVGAIPRPYTLHHHVWTRQVWRGLQAAPHLPPPESSEQRLGGEARQEGRCRPQEVLH